MKQLLEKWIKQYYELSEKAQNIERPYKDLKDMPRNEYTELRVVRAEMLTIYDHIKEVQKLLKEAVDKVDEDLF